jgi:hypothetical protein
MKYSEFLTNRKVPYGIPTGTGIHILRDIISCIDEAIQQKIQQNILRNDSKGRVVKYKNDFAYEHKADIYPKKGITP